MKFIYFFIYFFCKEILGVSSTNNYFEGLIKYLKKDSKLHQVVFIHDGQFADPIMNTLEKKVNMHFPSLSIRYSDMTSNIREYTKLIRLPRRTTLFILHCRNSSSIVDLRKFMHRMEIKLSECISKPRYLIVNPSPSTHDYLNKTLHFFWQDQYLDLTILTYNQDCHELFQVNSSLPFLSLINPFTMKYSSQVLSDESHWFPNKLRNLNGYEMDFRIVSVDEDDARVHLMETEMQEIFAQSLNLTLNNQSTHAEFFLYSSEQYFNKKNKFYCIGSQITRWDEVKAVIPKTAKVTKYADVSSEFWYMLLITIGMIGLIVLICFLLKLNRSALQAIDITKIIIGISTTQEPDNILERIVFGSLLITSLVYTNYIFSVILDITWRPEPEISNFEELANSSLTLKMDSLLKKLSLSYNASPFRQLAERSTSYETQNNVFSNCLKNLADYRNVSCFIPNAEFYVNKYKAENRELNAKILPESVQYSASSWTASYHSPFNERFYEIFLKASEFGFLKDFYTSDVQSHKPLPPENIGKEKLLLILFYLLTIGYSLSTIAFLLEICIGRFGSEIYNFYTRFRIEN